MRTALREMSTRDLFWELLTNPSDSSKIRQVIKDRMVIQGVPHPCDLMGFSVALPPREEPRRILDLSRENFPWMNDEPVLDWMREMHPYQIAELAKEDGFACQNMTNPQQAIDWMDLAILQRSEWRGLNPSAVRFWKAIYGKWSLWKMKGRPNAM